MPLPSQTRDFLLLYINISYIYPKNWDREIGVKMFQNNNPLLTYLRVILSIQENDHLFLNIFSKLDCLLNLLVMSGK